MIKILTRLTILGAVLITLTGCFQSADLQPLAPTLPGSAPVANNPTVPPITPTQVEPPTLDPNLMLTETAVAAAQASPEVPTEVVTENVAQNITPTEVIPTQVAVNDADMTLTAQSLFPAVTESATTPEPPTPNNLVQSSPMPTFTEFPTFTPPPTNIVASPTEIPTLPPTATLPPTETPLPTNTLPPTATFTPIFTETPLPTATLLPSSTSIPPTIAAPTDGAMGTIDAQCNYKVEQDDRILRIALRFNRTVEELVRANPTIVNIQVIYVGQLIKIPDCLTR